jgi:hypothetical protein
MAETNADGHIGCFRHQNSVYAALPAKAFWPREAIVNGNETARLTATPIGRLRCIETEEDVGFIYLWNTGEFQLALNSRPNRPDKRKVAPERPKSDLGRKHLRCVAASTKQTSGNATQSE